MINVLRKQISPHLINIPGWHTTRKIVVIESDDWGSVRVSGKGAYSRLLKAGIPVNESAYGINDALECNSDLERLMDTLINFRDIYGNPCVFTMNNIVANPDFDKIKYSNYQEYYYEPFTDTLKRYPHHDNVLNLYREGIERKVFKPQFHGKEHVNKPYWLSDLKLGRKETVLAFKENMFSIPMRSEPLVKYEYMDALNFQSSGTLSEQKESLRSGLSLFKAIWGYSSKSFIAPAYIWHPDIESTLKDNGVKYIQGVVNQIVPKNEGKYSFRKKYHFTGQKNRLGQYYLIRNVFFEPSVLPHKDNVSDVLKRIEIAFSWNKPAIISTHRLNYIGWINSSNSSKSLKSLRLLIDNILKNWPETEFMTSDKLGDIISDAN